MAPQQGENAARALRDLQSGEVIKFDGVDVTSEWIRRYQELAERYERLVAMYEQRERETRLSDSIKFTE